MNWHRDDEIDKVLAWSRSNDCERTSLLRDEEFKKRYDFWKDKLPKIISGVELSISLNKWDLVDNCGNFISELPPIETSEQQFQDIIRYYLENGCE
ncbi:MAG: hypothetical protein ACYDDE_00765 [bacterium]